jgi:hypothetical protein
MSGSSHQVTHCEYVLPDGRRFNCNTASLPSMPTAEQIVTSKACVALPRVVAPMASPGVVEAIGKARACLRRSRLAVAGGPVPPEGHGPGGPEGELITGGALIGFYIDARTAKRAEPGVVHNARAFHGDVERRGAVTILWVAHIREQVRSRVERCVFR